MKIQDVFESGREEDKLALYQRHTELMKELREKRDMKKVERNDSGRKSQMQKNELKEEEEKYLESLERIKAAAIASRIARGEEVAKAQEDFLTARYPDMLNDATVIKNRIQNVLKKIEGIKSRKEAEKFLQKADQKILTMPFGKNNDTVFDKAVEIIKDK